MKKMLNEEVIEGRLYQHSLVAKTVKDKESKNFGKPFISGNIEIAVDENGLNVIPVHFTYVTPQTAKGGKNLTYAFLEKIINENKTWIEVGKDEALKIKATPAISLTEFYKEDGTLISVKTNEGGFLNNVNELSPEKNRNTFKADMLITSITEKEANPEKNIDAYVAVRGAIFDFRNRILPVEFKVCSEEGMNYFLSEITASPKEPYFVCVWGRLNCLTESTEKTTESAFGEASVTFYENKRKDWIITGISKAPYDFGDESILTVEDVTKAMQDREIQLAEIKKRREEYNAKNSGNSNSASASAPAATVKNGDFQF